MTKASESAAVPADDEVSYDAFISYSMTADEVLAPRLRVALQRFAVAWYRRRAIRVFCAPSDMAANPRLWGRLQNSLVASRYLILLASPEAAASDWVGRELEWWRENRPPETLLIAVTGGVLRWGQAEGDFDWDQTTAIPWTLAGHFDDEPYWVDLRETPRPGEGGRDPGHDATFQDAVATLGAAIRSRPKSDLVGEDIRQRRRALALAGTHVVAAGDDTGRVVIWDLESRRPGTLLKAHRGVVTGLAFSPDGNSVATASPDGTRTGKVVHRMSGHYAPVRAMTFVGRNGDLLATGSADERVLLWDVRSERVVRRLEAHTGPVSSMAVGKDGRCTRRGRTATSSSGTCWATPSALTPTALGRSPSGRTVRKR